MTVPMTGKLYRFVPFEDIDWSDASTIPVPVFSFKERDVYFDFVTDTFYTVTIKQNDVRWGLSLRNAIPGYLSRLIETQKVSGGEHVPLPHDKCFEEVSGDAFFWSADEIADYPQAEFPKTIGLQLYFCCYEVTMTAMCDLPAGLGYTSDDFPVSGHGTIHTTGKVACEQVDTDQESFICVPGMDSLPWRFVGISCAPVLNPMFSCFKARHQSSRTAPA
jgi:hypothetical protein